MSQIIYMEMILKLTMHFNSCMTEFVICPEAIQVWMGNNKLILNPEKTESISISNNGNSLTLSLPVNLIGNTMGETESVTHLGAILDANNSMQRHMVNLCLLCYHHLWELWRVRRYLTHETAVKLTNAMISRTSGLLQHSALLCEKRQISVQFKNPKHPMSHCVKKNSKNSHMTPLLHKLHWFPSQYHILFKYNLITYKAINVS